jgi:hypothetical protein
MKTTTQLVREHMSRGEWVTPYSVQSSIRVKYGRQVSDSAITARIRELRRPEYGGHTVESRPVGGDSKAHEYRMKVEPAQMSLTQCFPEAHLEVLIGAEIAR